MQVVSIQKIKSSAGITYSQHIAVRLKGYFKGLGRQFSWRTKKLEIRPRSIKSDLSIVARRCQPSVLRETQSVNWAFRRGVATAPSIVALVVRPYFIPPFFSVVNA